MLWVELSKDVVHGGKGWDFGICLWSPTRKDKTNGKWGYWETIKDIKAGDTIFHI